MDCAVCGAPIGRHKTGCLICGNSNDKTMGRTLDRQVEAAAYEDLFTALEGEETLMGATRGRVMGGWRIRAFLNPRAMLSPFANIGLTANRIIVQPVLPSTGKSVPNCAAAIPLSDVYSITVAEADPIVPGKTVRIVIQLSSGETFRMRVTGRMASAASGLADVWRSLYPSSGATGELHEKCPKCRKELDRIYSYCPYCGAVQEDN
jgi:hypothetical protein